MLTTLTPEQALPIKQAITVKLDHLMASYVDPDLKSSTARDFEAGTFTIDGSPALAAHLVIEAVQEHHKTAQLGDGTVSIETYEDFERLLSPETATADKTRIERHNLLHSRYAPATQASYVQYVRDCLVEAFGNEGMAGYNPFTAKQRYVISETASRRHTLITTGSGQGKTTLLKRIAYHYAENYPETCLIILDPHRDLAPEVARHQPDPLHASDDTTPDFEGRLIYIDPHPTDGFQAVLNPLDVPLTSYDDAIVAAEKLTGAYRRILGKEITFNTYPLLQSCITALLLMEDTSPEDLLSFMCDDRDPVTDKPRNQTLYETALQLLPATERQYRLLKERFHSHAFKASKASLLNHLEQAMLSPTFRRFSTGRSTFDLFESIAAQKILVFNLDQQKLGQQTSCAIGQHIMALVQFYSRSMLRAEFAPKHPIHLIAEDAHEFISDTTREFLAEPRRYGLSFTFSSQGIDPFPDSIKTALSNIQVLLAGHNTDPKTVNFNTHRLNGVTKDDIRATRAFQFHAQKHFSQPSMLVQAHPCQNQSIDDEAWTARLAAQHEQYYRKADAPILVSDLRQQARKGKPPGDQKPFDPPKWD